MTWFTNNIGTPLGGMAASAEETALTGSAGGIDKKRALLTLEGRGGIAAAPGGRNL
jgi:hypothetical protein